MYAAAEAEARKTKVLQDALAKGADGWRYATDRRAEVLGQGPAARSRNAAGINAAKSAFSMCGEDCARQLVLERTMSRDRLLALFANLAPCTVGTCSGASS
jgi:hypothetical protein